MKILITGCNGQLGTEMRNVLEDKMPGKTIYTDVAELDLTDADAIKSFVAANEITHIVNCAAYTAVDKAETDQGLCSRINVDAVKNLADAAYEQGAKVIHVSTDYVFDGTGHSPYKESDAVHPVSHYGVTKRQGEATLLALLPESVIVRTAWLYSPYGNNFVKTMRRLGRERSELGVVADQVGTPTAARDLADAIYAILTAPQWMPGIYHFTDEGAASWYDFTKAIHRISGIKGCNVKPITTADYPTPATRPAYSILDKSKIKKTFGITIPHWEESLVKCIETLDEMESK